MSPVLKHKEIYPGRIQSDNKDNENIQRAMAEAIHPLELDTHSCNKDSDGILQFYKSRPLF